MVKRKIEELNLLDDFLFQETISRGAEGEEVCRILLSTILGKNIRRVRITPQKPLLGADTTRHGIRLDAYIEDISENQMPSVELSDAEVLPDIYDIEPNQTYEKSTLPKRTRYYHALIDSKILDAGADYKQLRNVVIIVILPYDPFGRNRMVYTVKNQCVEDHTVPYEDGIQKLYLYTKGTEGYPGQELKDMLKYMEKSIEDNVKNQNLAVIHRIISEVRQDKEVGISYMKSWEHDQLMRQEGLERGLEQGIEALILDNLEENNQQEKILEKLQKRFKLDICQAKAYYDKYAKNGK